MTRLVTLLIVVGVSGCIAYNPDCPLDTSAVAGVSDVHLDVRRSLLRTQEAPIGNLITDAIFSYAAAQPLPIGKEVDLAVINAGAIRDVNRCGAFEAVGPGPITIQQLNDLLPFDNRVELVEISGAHLLRVLEHSVSRLGEAGDWGLAGQFLQVSHLSFRVDCARTAAVGQEIVGSRVVDGEVTLIRDDGPNEMIEATRDYYVATHTFLLEGGDGYDTLLSRQVVVSDEDLDSDVVVLANYLSGRESVAPQVEGRILLDANCTVAR